MHHKNENHEHFFHVKSNKIAPAKGRVLIAEPLLQGRHFARSVILLTDHNEKGSMGLVLNKPLSVNVNDMVDALPTLRTPLFLGGPVHTNHLFYIHTLGNLVPQSYPLGARLFWGGDLKTLHRLIDEKIATPEQVRFFTGYAGWGEGQLQDEIQEKSWMVSLLSTQTIMHTDTKPLWQTAVAELGRSYKNWLHFPENPILN